MIHRDFRMLVVAILATTTVGCGESDLTSPPVAASGDVVEGADGNDVVQFQPGDAAMEVAMRKGKKTVGRFFTALGDKKSNQDRFNLKVTLRSGEQLERIWLDEVAPMDDGKISGVLLNQPFYSTAHEQGDRIAVSRDDIVDWSYIDDGYLIGGYTLRVMFEQYPDHQRDELQERLEYKIDPTRGT